MGALRLGRRRRLPGLQPIEGRVANSECNSIANYVQCTSPPAANTGIDGVLLRWRGCNRPAVGPCAPRMGMPGRGMMFIGDKGVQVSAFYGGSPSLRTIWTPAPARSFQGLPGGWL